MCAAGSSLLLQLFQTMDPGLDLFEDVDDFNGLELVDDSDDSDIEESGAAARASLQSQSSSPSWPQLMA